MKKLLVLSFVLSITCNAQIFSMESKSEKYNSKQVYHSPTIGLCEENEKAYCRLSDYDINIIQHFEVLSANKILELKETNPKILENIDCLLYYLLFTAEQISGENNKWLNIKGWKNTFYDYGKKLAKYIVDPIVGPSDYTSCHEVLNVFIDTFSSNVSDNLSDKEKENKEIMKKCFKYQLRKSIDRVLYNKINKCV